VIPKPLATAIIIVVTLVWAVNFAAQFIVDDYSPDVAINGIFMAVVGGALALSRRKDGKDEKDDSKKQEEDPEPASPEAN
jgi:hypothetical protein